LFASLVLPSFVLLREVTEFRRNRLTLKPFCTCIALSALCLFTVTALSQTAAQKSSAKCRLSDEDYSVFTAVLKGGLATRMDPKKSWPGKEIFVVNLTEKIDENHRDDWSAGSKSKPVPSEETRSDYEARSKYRCRLKPGWGDPHLYKPLASEEMPRYVNRGGKHIDGWQEFYRSHPKAAGVWKFSRPGYNSARNQALLYVIHDCGMLCGTGQMYLLEKEHGRWKVKNRLLLWIS
jgi:hypothetical protein